MAIKLGVHEYCSLCMDFTPEVKKPVKMFSNDEVVYQSDTIVKCENRHRCEEIRRYLEREARKE